NKKDERGIVIINEERLVAQRYTQEKRIDYDEVFAPVARIEVIRLFLAYASFKDFMVYQMDVKSAFLYKKIKKEVYVCQPPGFEDLDFLDRVYKVEKALYGLHQALRAWFLKVKTTSTPMETQKPLLKDEDGKEVDVHMYRLMIGSLMYLTSSRPDIMFVVCACARYQFRSTAMAKTINGEVQLHARVDGKKIFITEASIRKDLQLADEEGLDCLPNSTIYEQLALMGVGKSFSRRITPLFPIMVVQSELGEGLTMPTDPHHTPTILQSSSSQPQEIHKSRKPIRKVTQVPQPSDPMEHVVDEAVHTKLGDSLVRAATTASSLEVEHDSGIINKTQSKATPSEPSSQRTNLGGGPKCQKTIGDTTAQTRFKSVSKHSNDLLLVRGSTLQSDENRLELNKLMVLCTNLQTRILNLEKTKITQSNEIASLKRSVKKLKKRNMSRTHKLKRLYKVGLTARVESFEDEESLGEDASKIGRIDARDADEDITLVNVQNDAEMFDVDDLGGEEVFVAEQEVVKDVIENVVEEVANDAQDNTAITTITNEETTLDQALEALKTSKPKVKGIVIQAQEEPELVKLKKKDQIMLDEEAAKRLQAKFDEEERLARERAQKEQEANITLIETWEDIQAKIDAYHQLAKRLQKKALCSKKSRREKEQTTNTSSKDKDNVYLPKKMEGYKVKDLKLKEFDKIQEMFDRAFKRVNTFKPIKSELVERKEKRAREELIQESTKKQKVEDDKETAELKQLTQIISDKEEVAIDVIPLFVKSPRIVDWKIHKEGKKSYYQIVRADGKSQMYMVFSKMLESFNKEDLEDLYKLDYMLVKKTYLLTPPTLLMMLKKKLQIDYQSEMAYQLLKLIKKHLKKLRNVWKHAPGVYEDFNEET
nr:retrovirus-related Pol polyprotein from transposon TNT 1-94 [Tanacetum cinerariifolium]